MADRKLQVEVELLGVDTIAELARYKRALDRACAWVQRSTPSCPEGWDYPCGKAHECGGENVEQATKCWREYFLSEVE